MERDRTICVIGLGYIGLPTASFLANAGYKVSGVDVDLKKISLLKKGQLPFEEPGLKKLFLKSFSNLSFSSKVSEADVFIISVPTPILANKKPNLEYVKKAVRNVGKVIKDGDLVVIESTVPPGTTKKVVYLLLKNSKAEKFFLSHAPERAIPKKTLKEMSENSRIIGGTDKESSKLTQKIYTSFVKGEIHLTDATTAETIKLIENTYRDINIAFANELAKLSDKIGINVWQAIELANLHPRVNIHRPGPGVGGHCIAIDPWFLVKKNETGNRMIKLMREINDSMPSYVIALVKDLVKNIKSPTITILGAAYKANIGDTRESPALKIIKLARDKRWQVKIHDPYVRKFPYKIEKDIKRATLNSDCLVIVADHNYYKNLDSQTLKMRHKNILDTRNCISQNKWRKANFRVAILGKSKT